MGKIDEVKELLNTLRVAMSIAFGILVILIGSIVKRYDAEKIDILFWSGVLFALAIIGAIVFIIFKIANKTKEIKDL
jgi:predicted membrane channel-forming protein YqfA (hemolysin III family)